MDDISYDDYKGVDIVDLGTWLDSQNFTGWWHATFLKTGIAVFIVSAAPCKDAPPIEYASVADELKTWIHAQAGYNVLKAYIETGKSGYLLRIEWVLNDGRPVLASAGSEVST